MTWTEKRLALVEAGRRLLADQGKPGASRADALDAFIAYHAGRADPFPADACERAAQVQAARECRALLRS